MKKLFAGIALMGIAVFASAQTITFNNVTLDYGTVKKGSDGNGEFIVTNTGDKPLIISNVKPGCGCTTPSWSKDPILPGKTGKIAVHYDTNSVAPFQKIIEVFSNDPQNSRSVIYIKGNVVDNAAQLSAESKEISTETSAKAVISTSKDSAKKAVKAAK